jgi:ribosome-binding protein aMBF1 (putative translation factor)
MKLLTFKKYFKQSLKDPEFKELWEKADAEYQISRQIIRKRLENKMSQQELAKKAKTTQAIVSQLENSTINPTVDLLKRISVGLGSKLTIQI